MENYKKKYEDALERAKYWANNPTVWNSDDICQKIFPEIVEKNEKIKACIGMCLTDADEQRFKDHDTSLKECLGWIEKQVSPDMVANAYLRGCNDTETKLCEKQKSEKTEPEFAPKPGDWLINKTNATIIQIVESNNGYYNYIDQNGQQKISYLGYIEWDFRPWTIQDAKDGDVLAEDSCIFIIQKLGDKSTIAKTYCALFNDGDFYDGTMLCFDVDSTKPATKEQCNLLFQKMHEAGYEWDDEKKEIKKTPKFKVGDFVTDGVSTLKIVKIEDNMYIDDDGDAVEFDAMHKYYHLWSINDVKCGDILAFDEYSNKDVSIALAMYKNKNKRYNNAFDSYCQVGYDGKFYNGGRCISCGNIHPATKEQRDLLFEKMHESGYEWDNEDKILFKKDDWTVDDSCMLNVCCNAIDNYDEQWDKTILKDWLRSLKKRVLCDSQK